MTVLPILENEVSGMHLNSLMYVDIKKQELSMHVNSNWFSSFSLSCTLPAL